MNLKNLVAVSAAAMAFSANAALFVTSSTSTGANDGRVAPATTFGPAVFMFTPSVSGSLSSVGMFAANSNDLPGSGNGFSVQVWQRDSGDQGTLLNSFAFHSATPGTFVGGDNEWRTQAASITLTAGTRYAISVVSENNTLISYYYGFGGVFEQDLGTSATSGVTASYAGGVFTGTPTVVFRTSAITAETIFNETGAVGDSTVFRIATGDFTAVPEPSTYALVAGAGLAGFGLWRRRSTKA